MLYIYTESIHILKFYIYIAAWAVLACKCNFMQGLILNGTYDYLLELLVFSCFICIGNNDNDLNNEA